MAFIYYSLVSYLQSSLFVCERTKVKDRVKLFVCCDIQIVVHLKKKFTARKQFDDMDEEKEIDSYFLRF